MAPINSAQRMLHNLGIQPRPDYSNFQDLPHLRHTGDLDRLRDEAYDPETGGPGSAAYDQLMAVYQNGLDTDLPSADDFAGAVPMNVGEQGARAANVASRSAKYWIPERSHPILREVYNAEGTPLAELPVDVAYEEAALLAANGNHEVADALYRVLDQSHSDSFSTIHAEFINDPNSMTYEVVQTPDQSDAYSNWRGGQFSPDHGDLGSLHIQRSVDEGPLWSGITDWNGSGGTYSVSADHHLQAVLNQQAQMTQGDEANVFTDAND